MNPFRKLRLPYAKLGSFKRVGKILVTTPVFDKGTGIHIFGHVHKEGGKAELNNGTKFFNVSHLPPLPYKLTGRKVLTIKLTREDISTSFNPILT